MANQFINSDLLSKEAAVEFRLANTFFATANRKYEGMFSDNTYDPGKSVDIRLDNQYLVKRGDTVTAGDVKETYEALPLQELYSVPVTYSTTDLSTELRANSWKERVFYPAVRNLVGDVNKDLALLAATQTYIHSGVPGTPINTFAAIDLDGTILFERGISPAQPWYYAINPRDGSALKAALQNAFNTTLNKEISLRSELGRLSYFDMMMDQSIAVHTPYTGGVMTATSIQVNADVTSGSTIVLKGLTADITGIFEAGDTLEITGVQSVNRTTRATTGQDMQFVVTADADSVGAVATVLVYPEIITDVDNPNRNVTGKIPEDGVVKVNGVDGTVVQVAHKVNLAYSINALHLVTPPLAPLDSPDSTVFKDPTSGLSLRVSKTATVLANTNTMRIDLLAGYRWIGSQVVRHMS